VIALCLNIASAVTFGHVMKWSTHRQANLLWVGLTNYLVASLICALVVAASPPRGEIAFTLLTGSWAGVCYLISLLYYFAGVARLGMGLATAAIRTSVVLPVAAALVVWHEQLRPEQAAGMALVVMALPLLGGSFGTTRGSLALTFGMLLPLFLITGLGQIGNRIFNSGAPSANTFLFLAAVFGGAGVSAAVTLAIRRSRPRRQDLLLGALLGVVNLTTNIFLLLALRRLPSALVFSVSSTGSVVLATLTGILVWKERLQRPAVAGVVAAAAAVLLLTI
jgi:drug/metabolite transporter (DMT)-like permease